MPDHDDSDSDSDIDTGHPWLVIPYFTGDEGRFSQRPLSKISPPVISWLCPAIKVQGANYSTPPGTYLPDEPLEISIEVDNRGVPNAQVTLEIYWADPGTGFAAKHFILSATLAVAGRSVAGPTPFPKMLWTPQQASIPAHFCLLAHVSCTPSELYPGTSWPDPMNDRHWAQYNLTSAVVGTAGSYSGLFWAVNPLAEAAAYTITARPVSEEALQALARSVKAEPVAMQRRQLSLAHAASAGRTRQAQEASVVLELRGGERQPMTVTARDLTLGAHQFTAMEMVQTRVGEERREGGATGSLGIVLFAAAEREVKC